MDCLADIGAEAARPILENAGVTFVAVSLGGSGFAASLSACFPSFLKSSHASITPPTRETAPPSNSQGGAIVPTKSRPAPSSCNLAPVESQ